ncbi:Ig-like domain-containing protein [Pontiellaceae bacterium B1224]|nr:Ig-like domain-containing protein [Pontiellaceae bacterium B1224]
MKIHQLKTAALIAGLTACCGVAHAVVTPYTADFGTGAGQVDVNSSNSVFIVSAPDSTIEDPTLVTLADSLQLAKISDSYASAYAAVETDLSAAAMTDFSVSSTITMGSSGGNNFSRYGFLFFGDIINSNGLTALFYPQQGATGFGQIRIRSYDFSGAGVDNLDRTSGSIADGSVYTFTLNGSFNDAGDLTVNFTVVNEDGSGGGDILAATIPAANLPTGNQFGVAGRVRNGFAADYPSLKITPSTLVANDDEYILDYEVSSTNVAAPGVLANDLGYESAVLVNDISSGSLTLNPDGSFSCSGLVNGSNTFSYAVVGGTETSTPATVLLFATLAPDIPIVLDDTYELAPYEPVISGNVLNNDTNTSAVFEMYAVEDDSMIANGALSFSSNGAFVYTPDLGFSGTETFTYQAYTEVATSEVATVTLMVERGPYFTVYIDSFDTYDNSANSNIRDIPGALLNWDPKGTASSATGFADINNGEGSDQYMSVGWSGGYRGCYSTTNLFSGIPVDTSEYWLYWEMYGTAADTDGSFGLSENRTPNAKEITGYSVGVRMFNGGGSNLNFYAYSSGGDVLLEEAVEQDTWYGIWLNINMYLGTYDAYMGDAGDPSILGIQIGSDIPFDAEELPTLLATAKNSNNILRINDVMNVDPASFVNNLPAIIGEFSPAALGTVQLNIGLDVKANAADYWPVSTDNLGFGEFAPVAHSDAPDGTFAVTNLNVASGDDTNKVIYLKTTKSAEFFQIENNQ